MVAQINKPINASSSLAENSFLKWLQWSKLPVRLITRLLGLMIGLMILATASAAMAWLERGDSGEAVRDLQNQLVAEGCYDGPVTGTFGSLTQAAVIQCQTKYGLTADGIVGPKTMAALEGRRSVAAEPVAEANSQANAQNIDELQRGSRGEKVIALQRQLKALELYEGEIDGMFGPMTEAAVVQFQRTSGLVQTGVFGELERQTIAATPAPTGNQFNSFPTQAAAASVPMNASTPLLRRNQLTLGDAGREVERLQARLKELKYFDSAATGYYGELTKSAVSSFQTANKLPASGIADTATLQSLGLGGGAANLQTQSAGFGSRVARQSEGFNNSGFNSSSFTNGGGTPIGRSSLSTTDASGNRFVVIIPKRSGVNLNQVRQIIPDATEGRSSIGEFIQAGAFSNQQLAEEHSRRLQAYNWDARVAYR